MKKRVFLLICTIFLMSSFGIAFATSDSGEANLDEDEAVLIDDIDDLEDLYNNYSEDEMTQEELKEQFLEQAKEMKEYEEEVIDKKFVVTKVISGIKTQYIEDSYYIYVIKFQTANIRIDDDVRSAVIILSYDVSDNKNIKPLKEGDMLYGYIDEVSKDDSSYNMIDHGLKDDTIVYVSISSQDRSLGVVLLTIFALLLLVLYAGKNGTKFLIPIVIAIDLLFVVFVPEMEVGRNIIIISSAIALELIALICILKNGWSRKTLLAIISAIIVVVLLAALGSAFGNANGFTGKGILYEENYDLLTNVYYIDSTVKTGIDTFNLYLAIIIIMSSVIASLIASKVMDIAEKYAGTEGMMNSIIEESKAIVYEYPVMLAIIFMTLFVPNALINQLNHISFETIMNSEILVTSLAVGIITIIGSLITAPVTAIVSSLGMGKVEIKQIGDNK